jgi:hypothetical protein
LLLTLTQTASGAAGRAVGLLLALTKAS